jgi:hypothetical protein
MSPEQPRYIMTPCERTGEVMLTTPCHRGAKLATALCRRISRTTPWRYFLSEKDGQRWLILMDGGYHAVRRGKGWRYTRDPKPVGLYQALREARA